MSTAPEQAPYPDKLCGHRPSEPQGGGCTLPRLQRGGTQRRKEHTKTGLQDEDPRARWSESRAARKRRIQTARNRHILPPPQTAW